ADLNGRSDRAMIGRVVRRISSPVFVGRVQELALLDAALDAAEQGEPGIILVGGDAGIGKTRFATEFAATVESRHGRVARGQSFPGSGETLPFAPFIQIVRRLLATEAADAPSGAPPASDPALTPLVRGSGPRSTGDPGACAQIDRFAMFPAVLDLVDRPSRDRPLAVLIEDLHWADESSLDLLAFVAGQLGAQRLVMLGTFRAEEL